MNWFSIVKLDGQWVDDYWLFALLIHLAINFAIWALFIWMTCSIIKSVIFGG